MRTHATAALGALGVPSPCQTHRRHDVQRPSLIGETAMSTACTAAPFVVELGTCGLQALPYQDADRMQLLYVPCIDAIVVREHRQQGGWRCTVIVRRHHRFDAGHIDLTDDDLAAADTTFTVGPTDADGYLMLWRTRATQFPHGGAIQLGAGALANDIRRPGTLAVDLDHAAV